METRKEFGSRHAAKLFIPFLAFIEFMNLFGYKKDKEIHLQRRQDLLVVSVIIYLSFATIAGLKLALLHHIA